MRITTLSLLLVLLLARFSRQATLGVRPDAVDVSSPGQSSEIVENDDDEAEVETVPFSSSFFYNSLDTSAPSVTETKPSITDRKPDERKESEPVDDVTDHQKGIEGEHPWLQAGNWNGFGGHWDQELNPYVTYFPGGAYLPFENYPPHPFARSRGRRSANDYWQSILPADKELEKADFLYATRNQFREQLINVSPPLHFGNIYTGYVADQGAYDVRDRPFGVDADFNIHKDIGAFKYTPHGQRLTGDWRKSGWGVFSHNLYVLRDPIIDVLTVYKNGVSGRAALYGGVYKFNAVGKDGTLLFSNAKTGKRYMVQRFFFRPEISSKFQALSPWIDPNGRYFPVYSTLLGESYVIKGSPTNRQDPRPGNQFVQHGLPNIPVPPGSILDPAVGMIRPTGLYDGTRPPNATRPALPSVSTKAFSTPFQNFDR